MKNKRENDPKNTFTGDRNTKNIENLMQKILHFGRQYTQKNSKIPTVYLCVFDQDEKYA